MTPLLQVRRIWAEPEALASERGGQVRSRFPDAEVVEIASHWQVPELHGNAGNVERWVRVKSEDLVLGCAMACAYCYVPRRKGYANPITVFTNIDKVVGYLGRHVKRQGPKTEPNQCDVADLVAAFREWPTAKASFATKHVNRGLLDLDPRGRTRVRFSVMPHGDSKLLDLRTSPVAERIRAVDDVVEAGYEVHLNLSPVVLREGWERDWGLLLTELDDVLSPAATQQAKRSETGGLNVRYRNAPKAEGVAALRRLVEQHAPWLRIRYAF